MVFSLGAGGTYAGFEGSLSSFSSCPRCFSTAVSAWRFAGGIAVDVVGADICQRLCQLEPHSNK